MSELIKILVIDDSEDDRILYRRTLEKNTESRFITLDASDGNEGLELIAESSPACILLDYSLPGRNGIEVLKRIRSTHPFIPVVMLTGQGNEKVAVDAMQQGAQNYISKSTITPETLDHTIHMAIEHCMLQKRIHEQRTALEVFTRALAHDLKEPVRTIRTFIDLIAECDEFSDKAQSYFQHIQNASDRMSTLIDTVFMYTRLDDPGQMPRANCDTAQVLKEAEENLVQLTRENDAAITHDVLPEVHANRVQLMQLLQNLLSNAIHHCDKKAQIHISAADQGDQWLFSVRDNGPGISEAYVQKIFEPFKRLVHHETRGAGLGLAICRKIVESHGGKIWCESEPGAGATFFFTLPKSHAQGISISQHASKSEFHIPPEPHNNRQLANILLVDDSRADIDMTRFRLLERSHLQCNFFIARGGEEALSQLRSKQEANENFDLVLLDINMPEMDGFEVLGHIRAEEALQKLPVVMCTGSIYDKDIERAHGLGVAGYLTKPIEFAKLKSILDESPAMYLQQENNGYSLFRAAA